MTTETKRGRGNPGTPRPTAGRHPSPYMERRGERAVKVSLETQRQITALVLDLDQDARQVVARAVMELWEREIGCALAAQQEG